MKRIAAIVSALVLAFPALALAEEAAALYASKCTPCHGKDGKGTAVGKKMGAKDLTALKASEPEIAAVIANGKGKMAAYKGKLTDEQIQALAKYVGAGLK